MSARTLLLMAATHSATSLGDDALRRICGCSLVFIAPARLSIFPVRSIAPDDISSTSVPGLSSRATRPGCSGTCPCSSQSEPHTGGVRR